MKILLINCSPVRTGATAEIVRMAADALSQHTVRAVCIDDYDIHLCRGCRACHTTARCTMEDGAAQLMAAFAWADCIVAVSPSYWADVPGQFKVFIDRCTPWCNTHEPHASIPSGKRGYVIALRTGPGEKECQRIVSTVEHFYGHLEIACSGSLCLTSVDGQKAALCRAADVQAFCSQIGS